MLVTVKELVERAKAGGYAVLSPSMQCEGHMKMAVRAAEELRSPIILNHRYDRFDDDFYRYAQIARQLAERASVPVAINQDHGITVEQNMWAIRSGYTSIMVDRQVYPLDQNIRLTAEMTRIAHAVGISVEAELGETHWGDIREVEDGLTNPAEVKQFVEETGIDCLAVCIGNTNSMTTPKDQLGVHLDLDLLAKIEAETDIPLVLHGGSGLPEDEMREACRKHNICKVNVGSDFRLHSRDFVKKYLDQNELQLDWWRLFDQGYQERMYEKMELFGSVGKAW